MSTTWTKFWKALGRILIYVLYAIVVLIIIGLLKWLFGLIFHRHGD